MDLDGTLLDSRKRVTPYTESVLVRADHAGVALVIATARPPRAVRQMLPASLLRLCWKVCYNGAQVFAPDDSLIHDRAIEPAIAGAIYRSLDEAGMAVALEVRDRWYGSRSFSGTEKEAFGIAADEPAPPSVFDSYATIPEVSKILAVGDTTAPLYALGLSAAVQISLTDAGALTQIMARGVGKESGTRVVLDRLRVPDDDAVVFGDDRNDLDLFRAFRHSVAVANAVDEIRALAWRTTASNDDDGVPCALDRILQDGLESLSR